MLNTYDKIYTIDLHGNIKKEETAPDGSIDQNVFDIMQGVSINIFIKTGQKKTNELGKIYHCDLFGKRNYKYEFLFKNQLKSLTFEELKPSKPYFFFVPKSDTDKLKYYDYLSIPHFFNEGVIGVQTGKDSLLSNFSTKELIENISNQTEEIVNKSDIQEYQYRPFDNRKFLYLETRTKNPYEKLKIPASYRSRHSISKQFIAKNNIGLLLPRQLAKEDFNHIYISSKIADACLISNRTKEQNQVFPLYVYPETNGQQTIEQSNERKPNLKAEIVNQIAEQLGLTFTNEKVPTENTFAPIDILDYIYAVLHSPTYREKYKEFLKIDFPRVPYPKDQDTFRQLVKLGGEIRQIHLLESPTVEQYITQYPMDGDNIVGKPKYKDGKVFINETQYFDNVPQVAWEFYIGGYQPAQKWLKDRKERKLEFDDILHYQKIIVALSETDRLMKEIDKIEIE
ncbi:type ISP restriction/modification enzyme [Mesoflavibacter sp. CH_XMU1422-2]|uniref:type ISP restriction/modification enzyme n=1 Tax=Mesoflavibacter sp. CH_XMU1422-2 TaxID=3107770 RepID=UPI0030080B0E